MSAPAISLKLPIRTVSESNARGHWSKKAKRTAELRGVVLLALRPLVKVAHLELPLVVTLTRIAPRTLDDDNLRGCLKAQRDSVAEVLGINDRDPRVRYEYGQERRGVGEYGVRIDIAPAEETRA